MTKWEDAAIVLLYPISYNIIEANYTIIPKNSKEPR